MNAVLLTIVVLLDPVWTAPCNVKVTVSYLTFYSILNDRGTEQYFETLTPRLIPVISSVSFSEYCSVPLFLKINKTVMPFRIFINFSTGSH